MQTLKKNLLFVLIFMFLFSPKFIFCPIDFSFLLAFFSLGLLFKNKEIQKIFSKYILTVVFIISFSLLYLINEILHYSSFSSNSYSIIFIRQIIEIIVPACCFTHYAYKYKVNFVKYIKYFLCIQFLFCFLMINMDFKKIIFQNLIELDEYASNFSFLRNFGIARNYLSWFPACCSLLIFVLFLDFCYNKKINSLFILILSNIILFLNSRTSIVIEIFSFFCTYLYFKYLKILKHKNLRQRINSKQLLILLLLFFTISFILLTVINQNRDFFEKIADWLLQAFDSIGTLFGKEYTGPNTFKDLNQFYFPKESYSLLLGYANPSYNGMESDIGYVRYLLYGGILLGCCLFFVYFEFFRIGFNGCKKESEKIFLVISYMSLLILQYKGEALSLNEVTRFVFLASIFLGNQKNKIKEDNKK